MKRTAVEIIVRTDDGATKALHGERESCHPKEATAGAGVKRQLEAVHRAPKRAVFACGETFWRLPGISGKNITSEDT
jgi:hypothetical protein